MASPSRVLIPQDTLLEGGRTNRPPLREWVQSIMTGLETRGDSGPDWIAVGSYMNNAALIEVYRGDSQSARRLCELQLRLAGNLIQGHDPVRFGELVIQPWVNLGRILRIHGEFERALSYFTLMLDTLAGRPIRVGSISIDAPTWQKTVEARKLLPTLQAIYVADSAKTHFMAGDFRSALQLLEHARTQLGMRAFVLLDEAELIAFARLGAYDEASAVLERLSWQADGYYKLVKVTYRVILLTLSGALDAARQFAAQLCERVLKGDLATPKDQRVLRYLHHLGKVVHHLGLRELAASVWHLGLRASSHLADVPLRLSFLESLLGLECTVERGQLEAERTALLGDCLYANLLEPRGFSAAGAADPVFAQLHRRLESLVAESASGVAEEVPPSMGGKDIAA